MPIMGLMGIAMLNPSYKAATQKLYLKRSERRLGKANSSEKAECTNVHEHFELEFNAA